MWSSASELHFHTISPSKLRKNHFDPKKWTSKNFLVFISFLLFVNLNGVSGVGDNQQIQAPRFTTQPSSSSSIVSEMGTKILQCHALGYPQPEYKWLKNNVAITSYTAGQYYRIQNASRSDTGSYSCLAKNEAGVIFSEKIDVMVAYMGNFQSIGEQVVSVGSGEAAILNLDKIDSVPKPSVTWQSEEGTLSYNIQYAMTLDSQLVILSASKKDEKAYRARAINTQLGKDELSSFVKLIVTGDENTEIPPEIVVAPKSSRATVGQEVLELQCIANARLLHELETLWFKDDFPIESSGIRFTFNDPWNRTLALTSLNMTHAGTYSCKVRLKSGGYDPVIKSCEVKVQEPPSFYQPLKPEMTGDFGSSLKLLCEVVGEPVPQISWYKNANLIKTGDTNRYLINEDNSLVIKKLDLDDAAMFQCLAKNEAGEKSSYTWVKVKTSKPVMEASPQNVTVLDGKDATLMCRVSGYPAPNITWVYNESKVLYPDNRCQILDSGDFLIGNVRESDAGHYKCVRSNEAGTVSGEAFLTVLVRTQIVQAPVDSVFLLGTTATLQCKVSSDPKVPFNVDWHRESKTLPITNSNRISVQADGTLLIQSVRASDVGEYSCIVTSPGGNETRSARLSVVELPYPPINVKADRLNFQRAVNVSWTPGFDGNSKIKKFIIQKREEEDIGITGPIPDQLQKWVTDPSNITADRRWALITNLKAASNYQFRVSAVNDVGEGPPSEPSEIVKLPQEAPTGPPVGFVASSRSSSEIIAQWQPPAEEHRNGQILGYVIRYKLYGYSQNKIEVPWNYMNITNELQRSCLITDLITWKDYEIEIAAYNNMGVGVYTQWARIKTKEGVPETAPEVLEVKPISSTAIEIEWSPPNPQRINGINQGYKIQAWQTTIVNNEETDVEAKLMIVPPNLVDPLANQSAVLEGLEKYTEYNITILCFTNPGDGERSNKILVKTDEDTPDEVSELHFSDISDRSLKVSWKPPKFSNGILTGYQLRYQIKDQANSIKVVNLTETETEMKVQDLVATTHYVFQVNAWTAKGAGPAKVATIQSGVEPTLPEPPINLALSNIEAFSVVLQFTPGFDGNSSIINWIVQAQTSRNVTWFNISQIHDPEATSLKIEGLKPFTQYILRIIAVNVAGKSHPSDATKEFQTIMAPPKNPPLNVTVRAISSKELRVRWIPLQLSEWYGNPKGYNISFRSNRSENSSEFYQFIEDPTANSHILENLEEWSLYEIVMTSCNEVGCSSSSPIATERTRESAPSEGPSKVEANSTSSTTIVVKWSEVTEFRRNGLIEGYKVIYSYPGLATVSKKIIKSNSTFTTTLTELKKYTKYTIQVLAYTRIGDGAMSMPPIRVQTFEDTPGEPSNVSFPDVSFSTARIIWDLPSEPNGEIIAYRISYALNGSVDEDFSREFPPSERTFRATNLMSEKYYLFAITAQTRLGWGKTGFHYVYTTNSREKPQPPSVPQISRSQIQSNQITFSWTPGQTNYGPLRYYTIQYRENEGPWTVIPENINPLVTSYTAVNLKPYTLYQFRIQATNDLGSSSFSKESGEVRTLPAAPSKGVENLKVVPITTTSVKVKWSPLKKVFWNGDFATGGYRILYQQIVEFQSSLQNTPKVDVTGITQSEVVLLDLIPDHNYEIVVAPFNSQGAGPSTTPAIVYVGEAIPTGEPQDLVALPMSSTAVYLEWKPPKHDSQNGNLLGYKIFYIGKSPLNNEIDQKFEEETEVVLASYSSYSLIHLDKFTEYNIQILAFNPAGDGPRSPIVTVKTHQDLPGPPSRLRFSDITMNSLEVSWNHPKNRNGEILGYIVSYETTEDNEKFSKQVKQKVTGTSLVVQNLEEEVAYTFTVRAQTIDYGPATSGNVTTGPQEGSPTALRELFLSKNLASVDLHWLNGLSGKDKILGYYIETKIRDDPRWHAIVKTTNGPMQDFTISYQTLLPSMSYKFRVSAYNKYGISYPTYSKESIITPSKLYLEYGYLQLKPFYRQTWFMVSLASTSVIIVIMVIAVLCVKSKSYKYKQEAQKTLEESMAMSIDERQELALELYRSRHGTLNSTTPASMSGTLGRRNTLGRKHMSSSAAAATLGKSPPRPMPASVAYHSDEESLKCYDENPDDSSVTEKPSEMSSSDSQNSESENESTHSDPHSFVNHYANINDSLKQSWNRQKPVRNYSSYTDSEPEGSTVMSLNGGQIIMNNMARSRAPLPGFSSFV